VHPKVAIFETGLPFELSMTPLKLGDDNYKGSRVIVLTDKQTDE